MHYNYAVVTLPLCIWDACTRTSSSSLPMIDGLLIDSIDRRHGLSIDGMGYRCTTTMKWLLPLSIRTSFLDACTRTSSSSLPNTHTHIHIPTCTHSMQLCMHTDSGSWTRRSPRVCSGKEGVCGEPLLLWSLLPVHTRYTSPSTK